MATGVFMPKLSMTMETGTIVQWLKNVGDDVEAGDLLLEVLTDKINIEVEAYASGKLLKIYYGRDAVVPVNQIIGYIGEEGEVIPDAPPILKTSTNHEESNETNQNMEENKREEAMVESTVGRIRATPAARKTARENEISLHDIEGSGPNGRIHKDDAEKFLQVKQKELVRATPLAQKVAVAEGVSLSSVVGTGFQGKVLKDDVINSKSSRELKQTQGDEAVKIKVEGIRKIVGQRMVQSAFTAPHVTLVTEVDMSNSMELRKAILPLIEKKTGYRVSYTEIIMKSVSQALVLNPKVNASLQGDYIVLNPDVNIGLAVAIPDGLIVPVVKNTDKKGLPELTSSCKRLSNAARDNKLLPDDLLGGTFTISNLGMYAIDAFTPIINSPETAILGVGRIHEKPVDVNGRIELRPMMTLSLSFDHRVIDGAPAAEFLQEVKETLENPYQMMV